MAYEIAAVAEGDNPAMTRADHMNSTQTWLKMEPVWAVILLALATGASASRLDADQAIAHGFATALTLNASLETANLDRSNVETANEGHAAAPVVAGSEDYWLRQPLGAGSNGTASLERVVWQGPVAAGGTLVIGTGASRKKLDVIAIEPAAEPSVTRIDMGVAAAAPLRVRTRDGQNIAAPDLWLELTHPTADHAVPPAKLDLADRTL